MQQCTILLHIRETLSRVEQTPVQAISLKTQTSCLCTIQKSVIICILDEYLGETYEYAWALKLTPLTMPSRVNHRMTWYQPCNLIPCRSSDQGPFWLLVVGRLSPSCLCSSDSVGTPPDQGVVYPYDTFQTRGRGSLARFVPETQPEDIVIVGVGGGGAYVALASKHVQPRWIWPQVTLGTYLKGIGLFVLWF